MLYMAMSVACVPGLERHVSDSDKVWKPRFTVLWKQVPEDENQHGAVLTAMNKLEKTNLGSLGQESPEKDIDTLELGCNTERPPVG